MCVHRRYFARRKRIFFNKMVSTERQSGNREPDRFSIHVACDSQPFETFERSVSGRNKVRREELRIRESSRAATPHRIESRRECLVGVSMRGIPPIFSSCIGGHSVTCPGHLNRRFHSWRAVINVAHGCLPQSETLFMAVIMESRTAGDDSRSEHYGYRSDDYSPIQVSKRVTGAEIYSEVTDSEPTRKA